MWFPLAGRQGSKEEWHTTEQVQSSTLGFCAMTVSSGIKTLPSSSTLSVEHSHHQGFKQRSGCWDDSSHARNKNPKAFCSFAFPKQTCFDIFDLCAPSSPPSQPDTSLSALLKAQIFLLGCSRLCAPTLPPCPLQISQPILHMVLSTPLISKTSSSSSLRKSEDDNNNNPELFLFFLPSFPPQELWGDCPAVIKSSLMQQIFPILRILFCGAMRSRWMDVLGGCQGLISM